MTALMRVANEGTAVMWLCHCECGVLKPAQSSHLLKGRISSCGCLQSEIIRAIRVAKAPDLTGRTFGLLEVVERAMEGKKVVGWRCRCACGGDFIAAGYKLMGRTYLSCGCSRGTRDPESRATAIGSTYGMLTVVGRDGVKGGKRMWACLCDCGGKTSQPGSKLRFGEVASCGCIRGKRIAVRPLAVRAKANAKAQHRAATDVIFAFSRRVRGLVRASLMRGTKKSKRLSAILGYSLSTLKRHLSRTMPDGHAWADFTAGRLEIDHVVELWRFEYTTEDCPGFKAAWALTNLQLLTKAAHRLKTSAGNRDWAAARAAKLSSP